MIGPFSRERGAKERSGGERASRNLRFREVGFDSRGIPPLPSLGWVGLVVSELPRSPAHLVPEEEGIDRFALGSSHAAESVLEEGGVFGFGLLGEVGAEGAEEVEKVGVFEGEDLGGEESSVGGTGLAEGGGGDGRAEGGLSETKEGIESVHGGDRERDSDHREEGDRGEGRGEGGGEGGANDHDVDAAILGLLGPFDSFIRALGEGKNAGFVGDAEADENAFAFFHVGEFVFRRDDHRDQGSFHRPILFRRSPLEPIESAEEVLVEAIGGEERLEFGEGFVLLFLFEEDKSGPDPGVDVPGAGVFDAGKEAAGVFVVFGAEFDLCEDGGSGGVLVVGLIDALGVFLGDFVLVLFEEDVGHVEVAVKAIGVFGEGRREGSFGLGEIAEVVEGDASGGEGEGGIIDLGGAEDTEGFGPCAGVDVVVSGGGRIADRCRFDVKGIFEMEEGLGGVFVAEEGGRKKEVGPDVAGVFGESLLVCGASVFVFALAFKKAT